MRGGHRRYSPVHPRCAADRMVRAVATPQCHRATRCRAAAEIPRPARLRRRRAELRRGTGNQDRVPVLHRRIRADLQYQDFQRRRVRLRRSIARHTGSRQRDLRRPVRPSRRHARRPTKPRFTTHGTIKRLPAWHRIDYTYETFTTCLAGSDGGVASSRATARSLQGLRGVGAFRMDLRRLARIRGNDTMTKRARAVSRFGPRSAVSRRLRAVAGGFLDRRFPHYGRPVGSDRVDRLAGVRGGATLWGRRLRRTR